MGIDFNSQPDCLAELETNSLNEAQVMVDLQNNESGVVALWANGATENIKAGDAALSTCAANVPSGNQSGYTALQTEISNTNTNYSNVMNGGNSMLTSNSQAQAQQLSFVQTVLDAMSSFANMVSGWAKGA